MKKFENQVVFITGGNSGIGRASAIMVAKDGAHVMLADLNENPEVLKEIELLGVKAVFVKCDISKTDEVKLLSH